MGTNPREGRTNLQQIILVNARPTPLIQPIMPMTHSFDTPYCANDSYEGSWTPNHRPFSQMLGSKMIKRYDLFNKLMVVVN